MSKTTKKSRPYHKLTQDQVDEIREKYRSGNFTQGRLSILYDTARSNIHNIVFNKFVRGRGKA